MALWRPCRSIVEAFAKSSILHQIQYTRRPACVKRIQGYVAVTPNFNCLSAIKKQTDIVNNNVISTNDFASLLQEKLTILCQKMLNGEIQTADFLRMMKRFVIKDKNQSLRVDDTAGLTFLSYCGHKIGLIDPVERRMLTNSVWDLLVEKLPNPTLEYYHVLLNVYAQNAQTIDPKKFLERMKVKPDFTTYQLLLNVAAKNGDIDSVLQIASLMENIGYPLNVAVCNSTIEAYTHRGDVRLALSTLAKMKELGLEPNIETYALIAKGYARIGDIDNTNSILNDYKMNVEQILEIVKNLSFSGHATHIPEVVKFLPTEMKEIDLAIFRLINDLIIAEKYKDARIVVNYVVAIHSPLGDTSLIRFYLQGLVRYKAPLATIVEIMRTYVTSRKYVWAVQEVCVAALIFRRCDLAVETLEIMYELSLNIRPHYYWPLLIEASRVGGEPGIFTTIEHMLSLNVSPDYETLYLYVLPFVNTHDPFITIRKFNDLGVGTSTLLTPLICFLLDNGNIRKALALCSKFTGNIDFSRIIVALSKAFEVNRNVNDCVKMFQYAPNDQCYPEKFLKILNDGILKKGSQPWIDRFLQAFETHGIPVSDIGRMGIEKLGESKYNPERMATISHQGNTSLDELECHLIELRSKGMNTRGILRKLLILYCRDNNVRKIDETVEEYMDNGFLWTPGMYSSLMMFYVQNNRPKEALEMYKELRKYNTSFKIDDFKLLLLSAALITDNQFDEAMSVLESACVPKHNRKILGKECCQLLNAVAHSSRSDMIESILDLLVNSGLCERTNAILGTIVRKHLVNNDLVKAVDEFAKCAVEYNCTPQRQVLFDTLIEVARSEDSMKTKAFELLDTVEAATLKVHKSNASVQMNKFVALIKVESKEETDFFFKEHQVPDKVFEKAIEGIVGTNRVECLSRILNCKYLPTGKKLSIYELILVEHSITGDCEKAIDLYRQLRAEFKILPRTFVTRFVTLLENHHVPVPEDLTNGS